MSLKDRDGDTTDATVVFEEILASIHKHCSKLKESTLESSILNFGPENLRTGMFTRFSITLNFSLDDSKRQVLTNSMVFTIFFLYTSQNNVNDEHSVQCPGVTTMFVIDISDSLLLSLDGEIGVLETNLNYSNAVSRKEIDLKLLKIKTKIFNRRNSPDIQLLIDQSAIHEKCF